MSQNEHDGLRQRLHRDDRDALRELYETHLSKLHRYVDRIVRNPDLANDLVHDVFVALWQARSRLDKSVELVPYLYRMARNRALRHSRDTKLHQEKKELFRQSAETIAPDRAEALEREEMQIRLRKWVGELPERQREALVLSRFHDLSHAQIAAIMGVSMRTVNNHIVRAVQALSTRMGATA